MFPVAQRRAAVQAATGTTLATASLVLALLLTGWLLAVAPVWTLVSGLVAVAAAFALFAFASMFLGALLHADRHEVHIVASRGRIRLFHAPEEVPENLRDQALRLVLVGPPPQR